MPGVDATTMNEEEVTEHNMLQGKKVIAIGERDGISGPAIAACALAAGAEVVFVATECFV
jgi:hypothetical protein